MTTTTLTGNPTSPTLTVGTSSTLTATLSPTATAGTVQFKDGTNNLGSAVNTVASGQAVLPSQSFTLGTHSLSVHDLHAQRSLGVHDVYRHADLSGQPRLPATPTTTGMTVTQTSPQVFGTNLTFNATVSPTNAVGTVHFFDGSTDVGHATVVGGSASVQYSGLSAATHSLTAQFQPTNTATFGASTSTPAISYTITAAPSTASLSASPVTSAPFGQAVTITATVGPTGVGGGTVQFKSLPGDTALGGPVTVVGTTASYTTTSPLPVTTTGFEAIFTPASANYSASPNATMSYSITPANTSASRSPSRPLVEQLSPAPRRRCTRV